MPNLRGIPPEEHDVECEFQGKVYRGTYHVERGLLTVSWLDRSKAATPGAAPQILARIILRELVEEASLK